MQVLLRKTLYVSKYFTLLKHAH